MHIFFSFFPPFLSMCLFSESDPILFFFCLSRAPKRARPSPGSKVVMVVPEHTEATAQEATEVVEAWTVEVMAREAMEVRSVEATAHEAPKAQAVEVVAKEAT